MMRGAAAGGRARRRSSCAITRAPTELRPVLSVLSRIQDQLMTFWVLSSRECSTSTQHEGAPRVPMRLARGTCRPASTMARQITSWVTITAEQGCQHLPADSRAVVCQWLLLTFCDSSSYSARLRRGLVARLCGGVNHARMRRTRRQPRCRGGGPVSPYSIDRRLRLCVRLGTQHLFVVMRRRPCVVSGVGGAATTSGGAGRTGVVRAVRSAACVCVLLSCGCGWCSGGACAATLAVLSVLARRSVSVAAACARAGCKERGGVYLL